MLRASKLLKAGFSIKVINEKLIISPKEKMTEETRLYIKTFRQEIINELTPLSLSAISQVWLAKIAYCLNISSDFLLAYKFIDKFDLNEQINNNPVLLANLIKTNPRWITIVKPDHKIEPVTVIEDKTELTEEVKANPCFNTFIDHLMRSKGACCHAPAKRYCDIGKALKTAYEDSFACP